MQVPSEADGDALVEALDCVFCTGFDFGNHGDQLPPVKEAMTDHETSEHAQRKNK